MSLRETARAVVRAKLPDARKPYTDRFADDISDIYEPVLSDLLLAFKVASGFTSMWDLSDEDKGRISRAYKYVEDEKEVFG